MKLPKSHRARYRAGYRLLAFRGSINDSAQASKGDAMKAMFSRMMLAACAVVLFGSLLTPIQDADEAKERAELAKALAGAKVTLQHGLQTSAAQGKAISAKFEVEDGKLQLSIYTLKGDSF